ncbi:hypothetical protein [Micromonospora echinaurantiaca]|uniref:hypothetical protein n=1 Tax=Micromonospora echinaurantiaca TaxID=47857 RepID=UPI0034426E15
MSITHRDPRAVVLVTAGWYGAAIVAFLVGVALLSGSVPAGCGDECTSDRDGWLLFGLYVATPALFLAMLVSLPLLWFTVTRVRPRSALAAGTLSATPLLLLAVAFLALALR